MNRTSVIHRQNANEGVERDCVISRSREQRAAAAAAARAGASFVSNIR